MNEIKKSRKRDQNYGIVLDALCCVGCMFNASGRSLSYHESYDTSTASSHAFFSEVAVQAGSLDEKRKKIRSSRKAGKSGALGNLKER